MTFAKPSGAQTTTINRSFLRPENVQIMLFLLLPTGFRGSPLILAAGSVCIPYGQAHSGPPAGEHFLQGKSNRQKDYCRKCRCPHRRWWLLTIAIRFPYHSLCIPLPLAYQIRNKM